MTNPAFRNRKAVLGTSQVVDELSINFYERVLEGKIEGRIRG